MFGSLVHYIEEHIANYIRQGQEIPYDSLKDDFINLNIPKNSAGDIKGGIFGIKEIEQRFPEEFNKINKEGSSYKLKAEEYLNKGIYRLERFLKENPTYKIYGTEQYFQINYNDHLLSGYIDRIFYDPTNDHYIIEDIKTKDKPFRDTDLKVPLQFVIYVKALCNMVNVTEDKISCYYDLPFCDLKQAAGEQGFVKKGQKKLDKIFKGIEEKNYKPTPSPLCFYCPFSETYPNQQPEGKGFCCYYSLWTPDGTHKIWEVAHDWEGIEKHDEIAKDFFAAMENFDFDF